MPAHVAVPLKILKDASAEAVDRADDETGILKPDISDEETDTCRDRHADGIRDRFENFRTETCNGQKDEYNTVEKHENECIGVGEPETEAYGVHEECVQSHAGSLRQRRLARRP